MNAQLRSQIVEELANSENYIETLKKAGRPVFFAQKTHNLLQAVLHQLDDEDKRVENYRQALDRMRKEISEAKTHLMLIRYYLITKYNDDMYEYDGELARKYGKLPKSK